MTWYLVTASEVLDKVCLGGRPMTPRYQAEWGLRHGLYPSTRNRAWAVLKADDEAGALRLAKAFLARSAGSPGSTNRGTDD